MDLILIAAVSKNSDGKLVIGKDSNIPWFNMDLIRKPDMKRFKELTLGRPIIMGRKTFDTLARPLKDRINIVLTRDRNFYCEGVYSAESINKAIIKAENLSNKEIYVIGGAEIYNQTIDLALRLEITEVHQSYPGNIYFPNIDEKIWKENRREKKELIDFISYVRS